MPATGVPQLIRCLYGADPERDGEGGLAYVHWLPGVHPEQVAATAGSILAGQAQPAHASVFVGGAAGHYVAESYLPDGTAIQFCGHGALAAAWVVLNEHEADAQSLAFANEKHHWQARRSAAGDADIALTYARPSPLKCAPPDFAETCLGSRPLAAAEVGTATDYLILELDNAQTVQDLQPDFAAINSATKRALIVTANSTHKGSPGCVFRYFAPQYGNPEDAATGSAAVQLAAYWSQRLQEKRISVRQLSLRGACMQLNVSDDAVELAARVGYG
jgi:predicted PhzF superfamily epimerase YddE/YHI9